MNEKFLKYYRFNKFYGFVRLMDMLIGYMENCVIEGTRELSREFTFEYDDFYNYLPEEMKKFSYMGRYGFMELFEAYITGDSLSTLQGRTFFHEDSETICVFMPYRDFESEIGSVSFEKD